MIFVPRGNGKTSIAAPLALYLSFLDGEGGAEGYAAAVTRDQARILFDTAREMVRRSPEIRRRYGVEALANAVWQERTSSQFRPISSDAKALDGLNVQVAVCDEIASHKTSEVYDVLLTAMGKRRNPLLLAISTATGNNAGIGKQLWDYAVRVLEGAQEDERLFALIYTIDPEDDPWEEASWIKANPVLGPGGAAGGDPRHHAPGPQQPGAGGRGEEPASEYLGQRRRGAVLDAELARMRESDRSASMTSRASRVTRAGSRQPHRSRRLGTRVPEAGSGDRQDALHRLRALLPQRGGGDGGAQSLLSGLGSGWLSRAHAGQRDRFRRASRPTFWISAGASRC